MNYALTYLGSQIASAFSLASSISSVIKILLKIVPDFTCHKSKPTAQISFLRYSLSSDLYSGLSISGCIQTPCK
jgi:hypothetical protein